MINKYISKILVIAFMVLLLLNCKSEPKKEALLKESVDNIVKDSIDNIVKDSIDNSTVFSKEILEKYKGVFSKTIETEATTSGMASITYKFSILDSTVILEQESYHEPLNCLGKYRAIENDNILELYYEGDEAYCKTEEPNFKLKKEGNKFFMKGLGGEGTFNTWIEIKKE